MTQRLGPGLHLNVPHDVYHADPCEEPSLTHSLASVLLAQSPAHLRLIHPRFGGCNVREATRAMNRGTFIHGLLLGGGMNVVKIPFDDYRKKDAQKMRDAAVEDGKLPMLAREIEEYEESANALRPKLADSLSGETEATAIWQRDGATLRCRMDALHGDRMIIDDLKACEDAKAKATGRAIVADEMHVQAAVNIEAIETLFPELAGRVTFRLRFIEIAPPYEVLTRTLDGQLLEIGRNRWRRAVESWARCMQRNEWPGYGDTVERIECPPWALAAEMTESMNQIPEGGSTDVSF